MTDSEAKRCRQRAAASHKVLESPCFPRAMNPVSLRFLVQMVHLNAPGYYLQVLRHKNHTRVTCIKLCLRVLPVEGQGVSLGLTAKHHLSAVFASLKGEHHAARLFGEHRPKLDSTSCLGKQKNIQQNQLWYSAEQEKQLFHTYK